MKNAFATGFFVVGTAQPTRQRRLVAKEAALRLKHGLGVVLGYVLGLGLAQLQILNAVVGLVPVDVMHLFATQKRSAKVLFHRGTVDRNSLAVSSSDQVSATQGAAASAPSLTSFAAQGPVVSGHAFARAAKCFLMLKLPVRHGEVARARDARDDWHN